MKNYFLFILTVFVSGCVVTVVNPQATGGSRSDAIIELSFNHRMFENYVIDKDKSHATALRKCKIWGFTDTEPFGGTTTSCARYNYANNCVEYKVSIPYQCL